MANPKAKMSKSRRDKRRAQFMPVQSRRPQSFVLTAENQLFRTVHAVIAVTTGEDVLSIN